MLRIFYNFKPDKNFDLPIGRQVIFKRPIMTPFIDFHTHQDYADSETITIRNFTQIDWENASNTEGGTRYSIGIHPWFLTRSNFEKDLKKFSELIDNQCVTIIGECGLDRLNGEDLAFQTIAFEAQIRLAESMNKPIVVHCVKAYNELVLIKKKLNPRVPMIVHGFNQNENILKDLIKNGFYISIGAAILRGDSNAAKFMNQIPLDKIFFETDDKRLPVNNVYEQAAKIINVDLAVLKREIYNNFKNITT